MTLFTDPEGPFEVAAEAYRDADMGPIALPSKAKWPPVEGWTGAKHRGVYAVTDADLRFQAGMRREANLGVRLPEDVVGIDIDVRNGGDTTVALTAARLGPLPPTMSSTSRDDGSRIDFFRVPPGQRWKDLGGGVETVWWGSRYAVAWPSVHPDTGGTYRWHRPNGTALDGVPVGGWAAVTEALPDAWVEHLRKDAEGDDDAAGDLPTLHPAEARRRAEGALRWLAEAAPGERNKRIFDAGCLLGGLWARLPLDCAEADLEEDALKDAAREAFADIGVSPDEGKANDTLDRGWDAGVRDPAVDAQPDRRDPAEDFGRPKVRIDVTNPDQAYKAACRLLGTASLSGVFRRDGNLVHTPRIGEDGYVPPEGRREYDDGRVIYDDDGPAQVRRLDAPGLRAYVAHHASVYRMVTPQGAKVAQERDAVLPADTAALVVAAPVYVSGARPLRAIAHTPLVLADGSVLATPGYDEASGVLYLPELEVPVPEGRVTRAQADAAVALLDEMLGVQDDPTDGFPFVTDHDRATFLAALLTPLLREVAPPPYPLIAIGAPSPGSGKSYLARILRTVHGGVFRAEMPRYDEELRKQITTILDQTTAPVVTFDNLSGVFASARFDGLLTSREWTDRLLGANHEATLTNDRLWTVTGNNLTFGGDMRRRVRWVTIDAGVARPEERTGFRIADLSGWVRERRGDLLGALLTLVLGWVQAGRPLPPATRSDDFAVWTQVTQGILAWAGVPGTVGAAARDGGLEEAEDADVLDALRRIFGTGEGKSFTAARVVTLTSGALSYGPAEEELAALLPRPARGGPPNAKSLGHWLSRWQDRPTDSGATLRKGSGRWWFEWDLL
jgi:hypothetical protein